MGEQPPVVYLLHGEDEFGIAQTVGELQSKLGDATIVEANTTRLDGFSLSLDELTNAASAAPFLATRRLVVVTNATRKLKDDPLREQFLKLLDNLPDTTALVLVEDSSLPANHWLLKWVKAAGKRAYAKEYPMQKGGGLVNWMRKYAAEKGGEIAQQAAYLLAENVGEDTRMAAMEIEKLLAYVNYQRPIEVDDVQHLAAFAGVQGDFFTLIDAVGAGDERKAMRMLRALLDVQDALMLFFSLVGHFRLLLQVKEVLEEGGDEASAAKTLDIHPFRAKKLAGQARTLSMATLEGIYHRLLDYDLQIKTGQIDGELALETLVASLTAQPA